MKLAASFWVLPALLLLACGGCSCEDSEAEAEQPPIAVVEPEAPEPPPEEQPTGEQGAQAQAPGQEAAQIESEEPRRGRSLLQAPADYYRTVTIDAPRHARETVGQIRMERELKQFEALKGRYPKSIEEFEQWRGEKLPELPQGQSYSYDASTGELKVMISR
ncbi:MAG: hypothetical protein PVJ27_02375 [Candidatus Brocadiaceae bacterium]|jgi:hypothetical protein